jgi:chromosome segregation ATPase
MMFAGSGGYAGRRQPGGARRGQEGGQRTRPGTGTARTGRTQRQQSALGKATQELRDVLGSEDAKPEQIKAKLTALRTAKEKAKKDLAAAQKELKKNLTVKQEALLVLSGYLN